MEIDKLPVCICRYPFPFRDLFFEILIKGTTSIAALSNNRFLFFQNQTEYFWTHYRYKLSILLGEKYYLATLKSLPDKSRLLSWRLSSKCSWFEEGSLSGLDYVNFKQNIVCPISDFYFITENTKYNQYLSLNKSVT